jgi:hypothetical protein
MNDNWKEMQGHTLHSEMSGFEAQVEGVNMHDFILASVQLSNVG